MENKVNMPKTKKNMELICLLLNWVWLTSLSSSEVLDVGVVDDFDSRRGKEAKTAMNISLSDFYGNSSSQLILHFRNTGGSPTRAFSLAKGLIGEKHVKVLMGFQAWEAAAVTVDFSNRSRVPVLSLGEIPAWASEEWPLLISAARSQRAQMKAVIAIVQSWQWRRVSIIYEDIGSASDDIIPDLINDFQDSGVVIEQLELLSPWLASSDRHYLCRKLDSLKAKQSRVFIVHTSVELASDIFIRAKELGLMEKESVWITTSTVTNQLDLLNDTTISSMQGVLGIKSYLPSSGSRSKRFEANFRARFKSLYPNEPYREPGLPALQAYDALWALAIAVSHISNSSRMSGHSLVEKISNSNFEGINGRFKFSHGQLKAQKVFRIGNVVGKGYKELGYWSDGLGFSVNITSGSEYGNCASILGKVFWPGGSWTVPRGYEIPTYANPLIVGVPAYPAFDDFVKVQCHNNSCINPNVTGFSVDVFKAAVAHLQYNLPITYVPYNGSYDDMIKEVQNQTFQAVIGDTSILAQRCQYAQFTPPYSESGLQAVVYAPHREIDKEWLFKTPFTTSMWIITGLVNIYNGFVVWLIERRHTTAFRGSIWNQIGTLINLAFTTLFSLQGRKLHSNMSRMTMLVWLFVALVVTQSYTASLTSLLTIQKLSTPKLDIEEMIRNKEKVGCDGNSFVGSYLKVLRFQEENILKVYRADEYPQLLTNGTIKAAFLITPYVKIFLAKNCNGFASAEPTFNVGGFGFVFAKGHPLLPDISEAVLKVSESGELTQLENNMLSKYNCSEPQPKSDDKQGSLGISSFEGLFLITIATSTIALLSFCVSHLGQKWKWNYFRVAAEPHIAAGNHEPHDDEANMFAHEMETYQGWA